MIIKQYRYYDNKNLKALNNPANVTMEELASGVLFSGIECEEIKIRTLPGVSLTINGQSVLIGINGIYEIPYREKTVIQDLTISKESLDLINNNSEAFFIITFIEKESAAAGSIQPDSDETQLDEESQSTGDEVEYPDNHD